MKIKHLNKQSFYRYERIMNALGLLSLKYKLVDAGWLKKRHNISDLFNHSTVSILIKHYWGYLGQHTNRTSGYLGFGLLHYGFVTLLQPKRILCVGSRQGFIPAILAMACKDLRQGKVDFVDPGYGNNHPQRWGGVGFWRKNDPQKHFSVLNLAGYITTYVTTSEEYAKRDKSKYGYIYIDGNHSYKGAKADFELFWPRLVAGGIMSFHDIGLKGLSEEGEEYGVWKLWDKLPDKNKISVILDKDGVGFIQKHDLASEK